MCVICLSDGKFGNLVNIIARVQLLATFFQDVLMRRTIIQWKTVSLLVALITKECWETSHNPSNAAQAILPLYLNSLSSNLYTQSSIGWLNGRSKG